MAFQSDESLARDWEDGRRDVLERIYKRYNHDLFDFLVYVVGDPDAAAGIFTDLFTRIEQSLGQRLPPGYDVPTLLYAWARAAALDFLRRKGWFLSLPPRATLHASGVLGDIWDAARQMNGLVRLVLVLANQAHLSAAQQSRVLNVDDVQLARMIGEAEEELARRFDESAQRRGKPASQHIVARRERFHVRGQHGLAGGLFAFLPLMQTPLDLDAKMRAKFAGVAFAPSTEEPPSLPREAAPKPILIFRRGEPKEPDHARAPFAATRPIIPRSASRGGETSRDADRRAARQREEDAGQRARDLLKRRRRRAFRLALLKHAVMFVGPVAVLVTIGTLVWVGGGGISPFAVTPFPRPAATASPTTSAPRATASPTATQPSTAPPATVPCAVTLQGLVFSDLNGDGILTPDESGLSGVTVLLESDSRSTIAGAQTDGSGRFTFSTVPGSYIVSAHPPAGFRPTDHLERAVSLSACDAVVSVDFGFVHGTP